jgi:hypothetical protein
MKFLSRAVTAAAVALAISAVAAGAATPAPPSAPRSFKAIAGDQQVTLSWSPPSTGTGIDNYQVNTSPADFPRTYTQNTSLIVAPLTNGRTYTFSVRAHNSSGWGPAAFATATPHVFPPGPPTNLAATTGPDPGQITVSWTPPTYNGSSPDGDPPPTIKYYTVTVSPGGISQRIDAPNTIYVAQNTADNVTYTFSVTATNSRNVTGKAAVAYAPYPGGATIGLQPTAGRSNTAITVTGQNFLRNESMTLYWDVSSHVAGSVVTDDNGAFTKVVKPFPGDKPAVHRLYASVQPKPYANFTLQSAPTPSPSESPSPGESPTPSPSDTPQASGPRTGGGGGGISGLDILTRPPFVFLPIIGILGLLGVLIYWAVSSRRRPMAPSSASVVHHATRPDYMEPFGGGAARPIPAAPVAAPSPPPPAVQPPQAYPPAPAQQVPPAYQSPPPAAAPPAPQAPPPGPVQWPAPPSPAAAPDEPPDLPEPSD